MKMERSARFVGGVWIAAALFCCTTVLAGGLPGVWKTYTSKREVRDVAIRNGILWAATSGGMFSLTFSDSSFQEFTTSEGLRSNDLSAITVDHTGGVWAGAFNGFLQSYDPSARQWRYVTDIARDNSPQKRINGLEIYGDTLFIASEIGLSEFLIGLDEFRYTARSFGTGLPISGGATGVALYRDSIWVSTVSGVAAAPRAGSNLAAPDSWRVWRVANGLPSNLVSSLSVFRDTLYASTAQGLARYDGTSWRIIPLTSGMNILKLTAQSDTLYFITSTQLFALNASGGIAVIASSFSSLLSSLAAEGLNLVVGTERTGVYVQRGGSWQAMVPKGPPTNLIMGIAVDQKGVLWAGTGSRDGEGFMSFDGNTWKSYTAGQDPRLRTNNYYRVSVDINDRKWVSNWGAGVLMIDENNTVRKLFNTTNGLRPTLPGDSTFVVVGGTAADRNGVVWITNRTPPTDTALVLFYPDSSISYATGISLRIPVALIFTEVVIDDYGTKWFANRNRFESVEPHGLFFYNERDSLPGSSGGWGSLTVNDGLTSDAVLSLAVDHQGDLWIGSDRGITIVFDTRSPRTRIASYHPLQDQIVQTIGVDPLNNKWVATRQGAFVLSPDGTSILAHYTVENTDGKLVDNDVAALAIDGRTGTVFFGSEKGLSTLTTTAAAPLRSFAGLAIAPNPFYVPSSSSITIDGLVRNSSLKILSIDGALIRELETPGGKIGFWDGTDGEGKFVSSGIYIIVAFSENGNQVAAGKVAILRR